MAEFEIRDNGDGSYHVRETTYDYDDVSGSENIFAIIAYIATIIGLAIGTVSVIESAPFALVIMIFLDVLFLSPLIIAPIMLVLKKKKKTTCDDKLHKNLIKNEEVEITKTSEKLNFSEMILKAYIPTFKFLLRNSYIFFSITLIAYWSLFAFNIGGNFVSGLMFFSMYGMYYFPYLMFSKANRYESKFLSIMSIISIFVALTATLLCAGFLGPLGDRYVLMYPVVLPTVLGLFSLVSIPIANRNYKENGPGKGVVPRKVIFKIVGVVLLIIVIALGIASMIINKK